MLQCGISLKKPADFSAGSLLARAIKRQRQVTRIFVNCQLSIINFALIKPSVDNELPQFVRTAQKSPYVGNIKF